MPCRYLQGLVSEHGQKGEMGWGETFSHVDESRKGLRGDVHQNDERKKFRVLLSVSFDIYV